MIGRQTLHVRTERYMVFAKLGYRLLERGDISARVLEIKATCPHSDQATTLGDDLGVGQAHAHDVIATAPPVCRTGCDRAMRPQHGLLGHLKGLRHRLICCVSQINHDAQLIAT